MRRVLGLAAGSITAYECGAGMFGKARKLKRVVKRCGARHAVYVGDEPRDVDAALEAGLAPVIVLWGYMNAAAFEPYPATLPRVRTVAELRDFFSSAPGFSSETSRTSAPN